MKIKKLFTILLLALSAIFVIACGSVGYYWQAAKGQLSIISNRQAIDELITRQDTEQALKTQLLLVQEIKSFAQSRLSLPVKKQFTSYVDIQRPYVVWNVFAAPAYSLTPKTWCYPIIGCAAYRGYYQQAMAEQLADDLQHQGMDVYVAGIKTYSTLGWFDDPILNTFVDYPEINMAELLFHELAHAVLYIADDTAFNESFATTVAKEALKRWALHKNKPELWQLYNLSEQREGQFVALVLSFREELQGVYGQALALDEKQLKKRQMFNELRSRYLNLKNSWEAYNGYDSWFREPLNNAKLITISTYYQWLPAFEVLLEHHDYDLPAFYRAVKSIAELHQIEREKSLQSLLSAAK